jgi:hypothetical protein
MPQTVPWQDLDGDWAYGPIWWCDPGESPVLHLQLRAPNGSRWSYEIVLVGAAFPHAPWNAPAQNHLEPTVELQPEPERQ